MCVIMSFALCKSVLNIGKRIPLIKQNETILIENTQ